MHLPLHVAPIAIRCLSLAAKKAGAHVHELRASGARPQRVKVDDGLQARRRRRAGLAHEFLRRHPRVAAAVFGQQPVVVALAAELLGDGHNLHGDAVVGDLRLRRRPRC